MTRAREREAWRTLEGLLTLHDRDATDAHTRANFGAGALMRLNPLYAHIHRAAIERGFRFTMGEPKSHFGFPLMGLHQILKSRTIPFVDNVTPLRMIEARVPGAFTFDDLSLCAVKVNATFHEAAHCLAHDSIERLRPVGASSPRRLRILAAHLGESFANACETVGNVYVRDPVHELLYGTLHSNVRLRGAPVSAMRRLAKGHGFRSMFKAALISALFYNFLYLEVRQRELVDCLALLAPELECTRRDLADIMQLVTQALRMNPLARTRTTYAYFKATGVIDCERIEQFPKLLDFDFAKAIARDRRMFAVLEGLCDLGVPVAHFASPPRLENP